jgi:hypothetical protein
MENPQPIKLELWPRCEPEISKKSEQVCYAMDPDLVSPSNHTVATWNMLSMGYENYKHRRNSLTHSWS